VFLTLQGDGIIDPRQRAPFFHHFDNVGGAIFHIGILISRRSSPSTAIREPP